MKAVLSSISPARVLFTRFMRRLGRAPYFGPLSTIYLREVPTPPSPGPGQVRIHNRLCGICGSDLHFVLGEGDFRIAPAAIPGGRFPYMGHGIVGEVTEVGPGVSRLKVGDRVTQERGRSCLALGGSRPAASAPSATTASARRRWRSCTAAAVGGGWSEELVTEEGFLFHP